MRITRTDKISAYNNLKIMKFLGVELGEIKKKLECMQNNQRLILQFMSGLDNDSFD